MTTSGRDPIESFYDAHPYPPPADDLPALASRSSSGPDRVALHLVWPARAPADVRSLLIAGCGTSQAVRHAVRHPDTRVVGVDVSSTSIDHTRRLAERYGLANLEAHQLAIEEVDGLGEQFDHVIVTGVLHHLADPDLGLRRLREVLAPGGAITLMVYAPYGRAGVYLMQDYCRRLGVEPTTSDIADLVSVLREMPEDHPLHRLLRDSPDFQDDDALADALLNPRDRAYSVPELLHLLETAGLRFGRWVRQAPYLPDCGAMSETPHAARVAALPEADQYAAMELFRGTMVRHTAIAYGADDVDSGRLEFDGSSAREWRPIAVPTAVAVTERVPAGSAAALINRAHTDTDLVMFVDRRELRMFQRIDGHRRIAELGAGAAGFVERLYRHDLVVIDATDGPT
jgi:SAM-dependent methyltransferase